MWVTHVHHDLDRTFRQFALLNFFNFVRNQTVVDVTGVAFCARNGNFLFIFQNFSGVAASDYGCDTQFTSNNSCVASTAPAVCNDSRSLLHDRFPVRVSHVSNKDVSLLNQMHLFRTVNNLDFAGANLLTNSTSGY